MTYLDTSVALAHLLHETRVPPARLWKQRLVASRLLEYELWTRLNAKGLGQTHNKAASILLGNIGFIELGQRVLARAKDPFPCAVRTLDTLHLASMLYLRDQGEPITLASYDRRLNEAATALDIPLFDVEAGRYA